MTSLEDFLIYFFDFSKAFAEQRQMLAGVKAINQML